MEVMWSFYKLKLIICFRKGQFPKSLRNDLFLCEKYSTVLSKSNGPLWVRFNKPWLWSKSWRSVFVGILLHAHPSQKRHIKPKTAGVLKPSPSASKQHPVLPVLRFFRCSDRKDVLPRFPDSSTVSTRVHTEVHYSKAKVDWSAVIIACFIVIGMCRERWIHNRMDATVADLMWKMPLDVVVRRVKNPHQFMGVPSQPNTDALDLSLMRSQSLDETRRWSVVNVEEDVNNLVEVRRVCDEDVDRWCRSTCPALAKVQCFFPQDEPESPRSVDVTWADIPEQVWRTEDE